MEYQTLDEIIRHTHDHAVMETMYAVREIDITRDETLYRTSSHRKLPFSSLDPIVQREINRCSFMDSEPDQTLALDEPVEVYDLVVQDSEECITLYIQECWC